MLAMMTTVEDSDPCWRHDESRVCACAGRKAVAPSRIAVYGIFCEILQKKEFQVTLPPQSVHTMPSTYIVVMLTMDDCGLLWTV